jgi:hypothetical protein
MGPPKYRKNFLVRNDKYKPNAHAKVKGSSHSRHQHAMATVDRRRYTVEGCGWRKENSFLSLFRIGHQSKHVVSSVTPHTCSSSLFELYCCNSALQTACNMFRHRRITLNTMKTKKQSHYRPGQALRVSGG